MACWFLANLAGEDYFQVWLLWISHSLQLVSFPLLFLLILGWFLLVGSKHAHISLSLMIFVEDLFGSVSVSPWDICNSVLIFVWYSFDFTHLHLSPLTDLWHEAWMGSFCSCYTYSVLPLSPVLGIRLWWAPVLSSLPERTRNYYGSKLEGSISRLWNLRKHAQLSWWGSYWVMQAILLISPGRNDGYDWELVESSVQNLLNELAEMSCRAPASDLSRSVQKHLR